MKGVLCTQTRLSVWSQPPVFSSSSSEPVRNQKAPLIKHKEETCPTRARSLAILSPTFQQDATRPEACLFPSKEDLSRTEVTGRGPSGLLSWPRKGCGSRFGPRSPSRSPGPIPDRPERPLVSRAGLPSPSGSGLRSPGPGAEKGGWAEDEEAEPLGGAGGGALPDSWGRHPDRYSRPAWRSPTRSRARGPGRTSAGHALRSGLIRSPERRPLPWCQRSTINRRRLHSHRPARLRRSQSARGLHSQSGRGAREDAVRRYPGLPGGGEGNRGSQPLPGPVAMETASLPSGASGLEGPPNCLLEIEDLVVLLRMHLTLENWESVRFVYHDFIPW